MPSVTPPAAPSVLPDRPTRSIAKPRFVFLRSVFALMIREMTTTYGRSPGGYIWAFAEPVGAIALLTLVFSMVARTPPLGDSFPLFFSGGFLPFMMYQSTAGKVGSAVRYSKPLLAYPNVTYIDTIVARLLLNALTQIMVGVLIFSLIIFGYGLSVHIDYLVCLKAALMAFFLGTGVGLVNCYLSNMIPVWKTVWAVLNRPLFLISGVFFLIDPLPENIRNILLWNPVAHLIMEMRRGIFDTYDAVYTSTTYVTLVALVLSALGMLLLHRYHRAILDGGG